MTNQVTSPETKTLTEFNIDAFIEKRKEFITKLGAVMVEGKDFHIIRLGSKESKSMAKGGAEKVATVFGWTAAFEKDKDVMEAFAELKGVIAFKCTLTKNGEFVGEGRGASTLQKNMGDPNKTIKMAQKSAFVDAVIRTSGLSDFYTQDLEDMPEVTRAVPVATPAKKLEVDPITVPQRSKIRALIGVLNLTNEQASAAISLIVGREIKSSADLTKEEGINVISQLEVKRVQKTTEDVSYQEIGNSIK